MYGLRRNLNSIVIVMMTSWLFILCLSFHCLLAADIVVTTRTTSSTNNPKFKEKFRSRQVFTTNPKATATLSSSVPILPTSSQPDPPNDQLQRPYQKQQRNPYKSIGYVAEWEYEGLGLDEDESFGKPEQLSPLRDGEEEKKNEEDGGTSHHPSRRVGPGTWQDSSGSWWLFGGSQEPPNSSTKTFQDTTTKSSRYLSDLWIYDHEKSTWRLVFRPESETTPIHSSYPENLAFPHICGSQVNGHMAVFGGGGETTNMKTSPHGPNAQTISFTDDNIVWLFDIPMNRKGGNGNGDATNSGERDQETKAQQLDSWDGGEGLWTSYICCDACLPDGNTTLEFCPRFSREPILWCGHEALMALQISHSEEEQSEEGHESSREEEDPGNSESSSSEREREGSGVNGYIKINASLPPLKTQEGESGERSATRILNNGKSNIKEEIISPNGNLNGDSENGDISVSPSGDGHGQQKSQINTSNMLPTSDSADSKSLKEKETIEEEMKKTRRIKTVNTMEQSLRATWWKFDLAATEWEKMPEVTVSPGWALNLIEEGDCRTVSDTTMVYILCPSHSTSQEKENVVERSVMVFDPGQSSIHLLNGRMELNNAFKDGTVWQLGRSTLHALRTENGMTLLFLAYHKLLDVWIHDHSSNQLYAVENVWKGTSLHVFQRTTSFYKITISFPAPPATSTNSGSGMTHKNNSQDSSAKGQNSRLNSNSKSTLNQNYSFYMANPRSKLFEFSDDSEYLTSKGEGGEHMAWMSSGRFHISIMTDQSVFLPSRDSSFYLINESSSCQDKDSTPIEENEKSDKIKIKINQDKLLKNPLYSTIPPPPPSLILKDISDSRKVSNNEGIKSPPAKTIGGKLGRKTGENESPLISKMGTRVVSSSTIIDSTQVETTTSHPPTSSSPRMEQKLTFQSNFNLSQNTGGDKYRQNNGQSQSNQNLPNKTRQPHGDSMIPTTTNRISGQPSSNQDDNSTDPIIISKEEKVQGESLIVTTNPIHLTVQGGGDPKLIHGPSQSSFQPDGNPNYTKSSPKLFKETSKRTTKYNNSNLNSSISPHLKRIGQEIGVNLTSPTSPNVSSSTSSISSASSPTTSPEPISSIAKKPLGERGGGGNPKRIPKGILKTVNGKSLETERVGGKVFNLLVRKPSVAALEPLKNSETLTQTGTGTGTGSGSTTTRGGKKREEIMTIYENESLRTNRMTSRNSSRDRDREDHDEEGLGRVSRTTTRSPMKGTTKSQNEDEPIQVTLSYTMVKNSKSSSNSNRETKNRQTNSPRDDDIGESLEQEHDEEEEGEERGGERSNSLTYGSSEIVLDTHDTIRPIGVHDGSLVPSMGASYSSMLFFAVSLSIFGTFGIVLFFRRCVKCPPRTSESVLIKEPPPIRYSVIPDELSYHTPIV